MNNKIIIAIAIIIAGVLIAGGVAYTKFSKCSSASGESLTQGKVLPKEEIAEKTINFINETLLKGQKTASLIDIIEENKLYKIKFSIDEQEIESYVTLDGKFLFPKEAAIDLLKIQTIGDFSVSDDEICKEEGKPAVYFFGSKSCPHCSWEHPIIQEIAAKFEGDIVFHDNMGNQENMDIFQKYSTGGVPTLVLGCKYYRVGSGENEGEETEAKNLTALICKLTGSKPSDVCDGVKDLINQIHPVK